MQCTQCEPLLIDYESGTLGPLEYESVSQHLQQCDECSALLAHLFKLRLMSSHWQDEEVPHWRHRPYISHGSNKESYGIPFWSSMLASAASLLVLVLVLSKGDLLSGESSSPLPETKGYVKIEELEDRLRQVELNYKQRFADVTYELRNQQIESSQLLLRTMLEVNRQERHQDLDKLMTTWVQVQAKQAETTKQGMRYLMGKQQEDDQQIAQLSAAVLTSNNFLGD